MVMSASAIALVTGCFPQPDRDTADVSERAGPRLARAADGRGLLFATPAHRLGWVERSETHHISPKPAVSLAPTTSPIRGIDAEPNHPVKRGVRPIFHPRHQAVLHRIKVNVIRVPREVVLVTQGVLPIAPLPNAALAFSQAALGDPLGCRQGAGEP